MPLLSTVLLFLVLLMVLAVLYLLLVPIDLSVTGGMLDEKGAWARGTVTWGVAGILAELQKGELRTAVCLLGHPFWFSMPQGDQQQDGKQTGEKSREKSRETGQPAAPGVGEVIATMQEVRPRISALLQAILKAMEIRMISIEMTFGLDDAAGTGEVFGYLMALRGMLSPFPWFSMAVTPVFGTVTLAGICQGTLRLNHPGTLLAPATRLVLSRPVRRLISTARGA